MDIRKELLAVFELEQREHLAVIRKALARAATGQPTDLKDAFRHAHSLKGAARAVDLAEIEAAAHRVEALLERAMNEHEPLDAAALEALHAGLDAIEGRESHEDEADLKVSRTESAPGAAEEPASPAFEYLRVAADQIEQLRDGVYRLADVLQERGGLEDDLREIDAALRTLGRDLEGRRHRGEALHAAQEVKRLSRRMAGVIREERRNAWALDQSFRSIGRSVERVSLVPVESIFGGFGAMVRELAREQGRQVEFDLQGLDVQADRRLLQSLKDPVLHLLRNAISHGAAPQDRALLGKPAQVAIILAFDVQGSRLEVCVRDDGPGPDLAAIEARGIALGHIAERAPDEPLRAPADLLALVFEAGFSTAKQVDQLSGRGMGLSVVAEAMRHLHGSAVMERGRPWGTVVRLSLPLSTNRQSFCLVDAGGQAFAVPTHAVERAVRLPSRALGSVNGHAAVELLVGEQISSVPVVTLSALLGRGSPQIPVENGYVNALVLRRGDRRLVVAVNALHDVRIMTSQPLPEVAAASMLVTGSVMGDDAIAAPVLSPDALVELWARDLGRTTAGRSALAEWTPSPVRRDQTILVVDDSITTRTLERSILQAQGYRVLLAVDGLDALEQLRAADSLVDLVIADVEMPRMDGFGLLHAMRNDPGMAKLPVILMTSRAGQSDVRKGLELGASAYLTKQNFDQRQLLATIGQLL
jgi:two-component system chemotaxis sensor kinase CheA